MRPIQVLLLPFSLLYLLIVSVRNFLYDKGKLKSLQFDVKTIGIGNLRVGGTGKTPHVEYLIRLFKDRYTIATLSRGYGRKTKGFFLADNESNASQIGDEPLQFYKKFASEVSVAVGEERALAIPQIVYQRPDTNLILLDDVFQHRRVSPHVNILLTEYSRPFYNDFILPSGRLREPRKGAQRADVIIVTKCPESLDRSAVGEVISHIRKYSRPETPVFFTGIKYKEPVSVFSETGSGRIPPKVLLVAGIANPEPFIEKIRKEYNLAGILKLRDHAEFSESTIKEILKQFHEIEGNDKAILLTEKDMVKIKNPDAEKLLKGVPVYYLPIEIYFLTDNDKFDALISRLLDEEK